MLIKEKDYDDILNKVSPICIDGSTTSTPYTGQGPFELDPNKHYLVTISKFCYFGDNTVAYCLGTFYIFNNEITIVSSNIPTNRGNTYKAYPIMNGNILTIGPGAPSWANVYQLD